MDAKKLGLFIAQLRKENNLTQAELAQKLQVTDKAVSKWECGVGLPDINTIEPLASALGVSVLEVMKAERLTEDISREDASAVLTDTFHLAQQQRKQARKNTAAIIAGGICVLGIIPIALRINNSGFFNIGSLLLGLAAWITGACAIGASKRKPYLLSAISFSACLTALFLQLLEIRRRIQINDLTAIMDTVEFVACSSLILILVTILLNLIAFVSDSKRISEK